jgi:type II secretory pathway pseudopilin PulG
VAGAAFVLLFAVVGVLIALLLPAVQAARAAARHSQCTNNMRQIALALQMYHDEHGSYPPAQVVDDKGIPQHSWRVLILPYLGSDGEFVYQKYKFDEPWNGPNNSLLTGLMPSAYGCPSDDAAPLGETSYLAITGTGTAFDPDTPVSRDDVADEYAATMMVIEAAGSGVGWMEPKDLTIGQLAAGLNSGAVGTPASTHIRGVNAICVDGSVKQLDDSASPADLRGLATIAGGETIDIDALDDF